ncbi:PDR/VanB family oxidoreductase [Galbitalea sp. SE-J8]|uniref:PDR/VanB family oxidoreductase n=1 Tax=Galbitalea sp. SE-J8 TaxID=3054952 RepID=UPI00259D1F1E|nr:PDR/VanB family oxidoreductase [Galbitalea sp. SE-J8]MDM4762128.1 PDR/VanB family oxidoreductase [Galbitalea sp. SE-J8]
MSSAAPERRVRVAAVVPLTADVVQVDLVSDLRALPPATPGSHIDVRMADGVERQYSLLAAPPGVWRIAVLRESAGRGGSEWMHTAVAAGDELRIRGARNLFAFAPAASVPVVFLAAGIGITPITSMIADAVARGLDWSLHYSGSTRSRMALVDALAAAHPDRVTAHVSDEGTRLDLAALAATLPTDAAVYACGPAHYLDAVESALAPVVGPDGVHVERFEAKDLTPPVYPYPFEVELALTGVTVEVPPERSILEVAEEAGAFVLSSCREGTCGTCETEVIEGEVDHRDSILTPAEQAENRVMYVCVSRAACPRLVLDL